MRDFIFLGSKITVDGDCSHEIKRYLLLGRKAMTNLGSILKSRDTTLLTKVHIVKAMVFSSSHVWMWELNHKKGWDCGAGGDSWESLGFSSKEISRKEIKPVLKESSRKSTLNIYWKDWCWSWSSSTLVTWCESWLLGKDSDAGKDWGREEKGTIEDEVVGWYHQISGHEFEQPPGDSEGQEDLASCSSWGC